MLTASLVLAVAMAGPDIAPDAKATIDRVVTYYKGIPGASASMQLKAPMPGMPGMTTKYTAVKPNQFTMQQQMGPGMGDLQIVSNGKTAWSCIAAENIYSEQAAPKTLMEVEKLAPMSGLPEFFFPLLSADPAKNLFKDMGKVSSGGTKTINGKTYDVLVLTPKAGGLIPTEISIEMIFAQSKTPWLHTVYFKVPAELAGGQPMTLEMQLSDWKPLKAGEGNFAFKAPDGAEKVDDLFQHLMAEAPDPPGDEAIKEMQGKPAPDFSLEDLDGNTVTLASLRGKTVILDFFATWCGPCKAGMPVLIDIAKARASDDVELWVIDVNEPKETITSFLESNRWDINVLLMGDSDVGSKYNVGGIPHTVVIGPDGTIQLIEVGFMGREHTEKVINEAIDKARTGKVADAA